MLCSIKYRFLCLHKNYNHIFTHGHKEICAFGSTMTCILNGGMYTNITFYLYSQVGPSITECPHCNCCLTHQADIHPSGPTELSFCLCSRLLDVVFAVCPAQLALGKPHQWLIEHVESAAGAVSETLYTLDRPTSDSNSCSLFLCGLACCLNLCEHYLFSPLVGQG